MVLQIFADLSYPIPRREGKFASPVRIPGLPGRSFAYFSR